MRLRSLCDARPSVGCWRDNGILTTYAGREVAVLAELSVKEDGRVTGLLYAASLRNADVIAAKANVRLVLRLDREPRLLLRVESWNLRARQCRVTGSIEKENHAS